MGTDKRQRRRFSVRIPAQVIAFPECERGTAEIHNVSEEGVLLRGSIALAPNDVIGIEIPATSSHGRINIVGDVRWALDQTIGVRIRAITPHHRARLERLIAALEQRQAMSA